MERISPVVIVNVAQGFYKIPDNVLKVMDGKTLYISTQHGRSYTVLGSWPSEHVLENMKIGIILEQPLSVATTVHEIGHIIDFEGIQNFYGDEKNPIFKASLSERNKIFAVPSAAYVSRYAETNSYENFAYYVQYPSQFREKINANDLLLDEYDFMRDEIFSGFEF